MPKSSVSSPQVKQATKVSDLWQKDEVLAIPLSPNRKRQVAGPIGTSGNTLKLAMEEGPSQEHLLSVASPSTRTPVILQPMDNTAFSSSKNASSTAAAAVDGTGATGGRLRNAAALTEGEFRRVNNARVIPQRKGPNSFTGTLHGCLKERVQLFPGLRLLPQNARLAPAVSSFKVGKEREEHIPAITPRSLERDALILDRMKDNINAAKTARVRRAAQQRKQRRKLAAKARRGNRGSNSPTRRGGANSPRSPRSPSSPTTTRTHKAGSSNIGDKERNYFQTRHAGGGGDDEMSDDEHYQLVISGRHQTQPPGSGGSLHLRTPRSGGGRNNKNNKNSSSHNSNHKTNNNNTTATYFHVGAGDTTSNGLERAVRIRTPMNNPTSPGPGSPLSPEEKQLLERAGSPTTARRAERFLSRYKVGRRSVIDIDQQETQNQHKNKNQHQQQVNFENYNNTNRSVSSTANSSAAVAVPEWDEFGLPSINNKSYDNPQSSVALASARCSQHKKCEAKKKKEVQEELSLLSSSSGRHSRHRRHHHLDHEQQTTATNSQTTKKKTPAEVEAITARLVHATTQSSTNKKGGPLLQIAFDLFQAEDNEKNQTLKQKIAFDGTNRHNSVPSTASSARTRTNSSSSSSSGGSHSRGGGTRGGSQYQINGIVAVSPPRPKVVDKKKHWSPAPPPPPTAGTRGNNNTNRRDKWKAELDTLIRAAVKGVESATKRPFSHYHEEQVTAYNRATEETVALPTTSPLVKASLSPSSPLASPCYSPTSHKYSGTRSQSSRRRDFPPVTLSQKYKYNFKKKTNGGMAVPTPPSTSSSRGHGRQSQGGGKQKKAAGDVLDDLLTQSYTDGEIAQFEDRQWFNDNSKWMQKVISEQKEQQLQQQQQQRSPVTQRSPLSTTLITQPLTRTNFGEGDHEECEDDEAGVETEISIAIPMF